MVCSTIDASDTLAPDYHATQAGGVYYNITRAYPPNTLQTMPAACYHGFGVYKTLKVEDLIHPPQKWITDQQCAMAMGHLPDGTSDSQYPNPNGTEEAAFPDISLPADMSTYDPAWAGCSQDTVNYPVWDPPRALTPVGVMVPSTTSHQSSLPSSTADPGWRPADPLPVTQSDAIQTTTRKSIDSGDPPEITQSANVIPAASYDANGGLPVSVDESVIYVTGSSHMSYLPAVAPSPNPPPAGGQDAKAEPGGEIAIGDSTIAQGSQVTIAGSPVSVDSYHVIIGTNTYVKPTIPGVGGSGSQVTVSLQNNENQGGDPGLADTAVAPMMTLPPFLPSIGNQKVSELVNGAIVVGDSTFSRGAQATFSNTPISVGSSFVVIGESTFGLAMSRPTGGALPLGGQTIQRSSDGDIIIGSFTLSQGSQTTISETPVSVESNSIIIGGTSYHLPPATGNSLEINGQSIERLPNGGVVVDGFTTSINAQTTVSGLPISVGANDVVIAGSTYELDPVSSSDAIGVMIASMFGFVPSSTQSAFDSGIIGALTPTGSKSPQSTSGPANLSNSSSSPGFESFIGVSASLSANSWVLLITVLCGIAVSALIP
ncbi:hypothetical protein MMC28_001947 [Mycoblastus sanguinarius]|nr:hypothetical protein [Mycoblastus sanguinarius]